jgi:hypothetical protein
MKTNTNCCSASASPCDSSIAELPRYYPRQLITPDDLTLEQNYFRDRMRRHNRLLHGWGVVCGALVCPVPNPKVTGPSDQFLPWQVKVQQGYILGPYRRVSPASLASTHRIPGAARSSLSRTNPSSTSPSNTVSA